MDLTEFIKHNFPKGTTYASFRVGYGGKTSAPVIVYVNGKLYAGVTEYGLNKKDRLLRGGVRVTDVPEVGRVEIMSIEIAGILFDVSSSMYDTIEDKIDGDDLVRNILRRWDDYTDASKFSSSRLKTELEWVTTTIIRRKK